MQWVYNKDNAAHGVARELSKGVNTRIFAGAHSMLSLVTVDPHSESPVHHHPEEQWGILLEGECVRIQDGEEAVVKVGDFWHTPGNTPHGVRTGNSRAVILDVFSPPRAEYQSPLKEKPIVADRPPKQTPASELAEFGTATLSDSAERAQVLPSRIRPFSGKRRVHGPAFTVTCPPRNNLWLHRAIYEASPGDVIVATTDGACDAGYWGELLTTAAIARNLGGLVIDGCVRDSEALAQLDFPVFASGLHPRATGKDPKAAGHCGEPVQIGDCTIRAGDIIAGDADGVIVLATEDVKAVVDAARQRLAKEAKIVRGLKDGATTFELLGIKLDDE